MLDENIIEATVKQILTAVHPQSTSPEIAQRRVATAAKVSKLILSGIVPDNKLASIISYVQKIMDIDRESAPSVYTRRYNTEVLPKNSKSGYRGVSYDKTAKKWNAKIAAKGIRHNLGYFDTAEAASQAYKAAAEALWPSPSA